MLKRLFPSRWARILVWTGAAVAWGTSAIAVQAVSESAAAESVDEPEIEPEVQEVLEPVAAVPTATEKGLVVIRYTPVPPPPPEVIVRTVTRSAGTSGASSGGGGGRTKVKSKNS